MAVETGAKGIRMLFKQAGLLEKFELQLENKVINNVKYGCQGFIQNKETGRLVYLSTCKGIYAWEGPILVRSIIRKEDAHRGRDTYCEKDTVLNVVLEATKAWYS